MRQGTPSDTHDKLRCQRCKIIQDNAELEELKVLPKKLAACRVLLDEMVQNEDAAMFLKTLDPTEHQRTKEEYERLVKQPMDFEAVRKKLDQPPEQASSYKKVSEFAKDVNRIFSNVLKVWEPGEDIADASRRLQGWWIEKWTNLVPQLMLMKADSDGEEGKSDAVVSAEDGTEAFCHLHNERGDDYQEQIGMPDEEDMRSWSHHHTTDTVDDPIFRAAMRGTESVSFVFGLEVTWSLIQERQQKQEAEELEEEMRCIEEGNEEDDDEENANLKADTHQDSAEAAPDGDDDMEDDEGVVDSGEASSSDEGESVADMSTGDDDQLDNTVDGEQSSEPEAKESMTEQSSPLATAEYVSSAEKSTPCAEAEIVTSPSSSTGEVVELVDSSQSSTEAPSPKSNEWACPTCTLHNKKSRRTCSACKTKRPPVGKKRSFDDVSL